MAAMTGPLISVSELRALVPGAPGSPPAVTVLNVRYRMGGPPGAGEHLAGHVPGATYVDLDRELAAPPGDGGRHPLPSSEDFGAAMRRAGVRADRPVVVYDDWAGQAAGRAWWLLRFHGHADVRVLDGGWTAWLRAGAPVETGAVVVAPGDFEPVPGGMPVVGADGVPSVPVLVDARAPERHRGETEPVDPVAGHIPGALNVPTARNLTAEGLFRPVAQLREVYAEVLAAAAAAAASAPGRAESDEPVVAAYCGSGVTAVHDVIALELLGVRAALYPGSWSDWITDPRRPVAS
jgi:thiosulfate/3-mercaptopyruvate sulfurtransferase